VRALKETQASRRSPKAKQIIYDGAAQEFRTKVSPTVRKLLSLKTMDPRSQEELIHLLQVVYAAYHVNAKRTKEATEEATDKG
jgi:hypothetical protein